MRKRLASICVCLAAAAVASTTFMLTRPAPIPHEGLGTLALLGPDDSWQALESPSPDHVVMLIHGLDEPGSIWNELAPEIRDGGLAVVRFEYPNDQHIADSADLLIDALQAIRALGTTRVDIVAHSMGGLVTQDALTRDDPNNDEARDIVQRIITVGTPFAGSAWARLRIVGEIREYAIRAAEGETVIHESGMPEFANDGEGEAGVDLLPNSEFITLMRERPPIDKPLTVIVGRVSRPEPQWAMNLAGKTWVNVLIGEGNVNRAMRELTAATDQVGDGVVSIESATALDAPDTVFLEASHRGLLRIMAIEQVTRRVRGQEQHDVPPAIPVILDRLGIPVEPQEHEAAEPPDESHD